MYSVLVVYKKKGAGRQDWQEKSECAAFAVQKVFERGCQGKTFSRKFSPDQCGW
jgi:hypothetical protein